ncbi:YaaL family protein [Anaerobacillus isosaccharinicus]|uniref:YaaL family protein n=1 Tax=Anaerobacillus isosaccharinicus TaxID=1532552 RepID=A0A1S2MDP8_9BACI|nr:YaaL family protein [Anaerobacillus isosaccharinicus]MBA5584156.1 YaaL family protein [Anaerobacillus isosaccharinicus]QOY37435.1 YaaL family protein [Anaerobacillus isosaccharinicus]
MLFKKKGKIRRDENIRLVEQIEIQKQLLMHQKELVEKSVDPSEEVILKLKVTEAKYLFMLKEARARRTNMEKS